MPNFRRHRSAQIAYHIPAPSAALSKYFARQKIRHVEGWAYFKNVDQAVSFALLARGYIDAVEART